MAWRGMYGEITDAATAPSGLLVVVPVAGAVGQGAGLGIQAEHRDVVAGGASRSPREPIERTSMLTEFPSRPQERKWQQAKQIPPIALTRQHSAGAGGTAAPNPASRHNS